MVSGHLGTQLTTNPSIYIFTRLHLYLQGRGSNNPNTGPQRDHASFATNRVTGAFAYIDAGHPRRPGDKVRSCRYIRLY